MTAIAAAVCDDLGVRCSCSIDCGFHKERATLGVGHADQQEQRVGVREAAQLAE